MSILAVGMSHHTADLRVLERVTVPAVDVPKVLADLLSRPNISEALLVSTCNRVEVYAVVDAFHAGLNDVVDVLARHSGDDVSALHEHLYVHYAGAAAQHLFTVSAGLDSMVVGEPQILGQVRQAYNVAREQGTVGRVLHELVQTSLRIGKRVHTDTGLDQAGGSVVSEALADAEQALGGLTGRSALIIGAGSMGGLAAAALRRAAIGEVVVANRTEANGARLAASLTEQGVPARSAGLAELPELIAAADVVVACTGAVGSVVPVSAVAARTDRPLVICDLGLPRDVEDGVTAIAGVRLVDLDSLQRRLADAPSGLDTRRAGEIVAEEVRAYLAAQRSAEVTPTVTALRKRAAEVVDAELLRLHSRLPDLDGSTRDELARTVRRVVDKLLHTPTVRVKELASGPEGTGYAEALRELFGLDPQAPASLTATHEPVVDGGR
ncbi:glutamyl-tRNA reductase [Actinokineospora alba]|uniref:Glutamyl-tRNA reductase n=1 Tax=Actinokineospora alba TaxID=504798 RepID=A0A1H0P8E8_9PSEU|nr:glutamyl-tRNA reductase [Actinokineospora alba]TDP65683.1 glutamyl-tRNA reductase [Actinokineospora alba]SDI67680.1 glutamyl-tRNA reductase [Actinokineospora alba]SDP01303.1 glutamyl-tRNA reductase [Actinokineospora alba]